jgi:hypothetical protein
MFGIKCEFYLGFKLPFILKAVPVAIDLTQKSSCTCLIAESHGDCTQKRGFPYAVVSEDNGPVSRAFRRAQIEVQIIKASDILKADRRQAQGRSVIIAHLLHLSTGLLRESLRHAAEPSHTAAVL